MKPQPNLIVTLLLILLTVSVAMADEDSHHSSFSGYLAIVTGRLTTTSNTFAVENENSTIYNHYSALDDPINVGVFNLFGEIRYTFETRTQIYVGVPYDIAQPSRYYNHDGRHLGFSQPFEGYGWLDVSIFKADQQVWENPYLTNEEREITSLQSIGFIVDYHDIFGSGVNCFFKNETFSFEDDEDDVPATFFPDLRREGQVNQAVVGYDFYFNQNNLIVPKLSFSLADMKGDSNSYKGYGAGVAYTLDKETIIFDINTEVEMKNHEKSDPLFTETREDKIFSSSLGITLLDRFGDDGVFVNGSIGYSNTKSTVDFYDSEEMYSLFTIGYRF